MCDANTICALHSTCRSARADLRTRVIWSERHVPVVWTRVDDSSDVFEAFLRSHAARHTRTRILAEVHAEHALYMALYLPPSRFSSCFERGADVRAALDALTQLVQGHTSLIELVIKPGGWEGMVRDDMTPAVEQLVRSMPNLRVLRFDADPAPICGLPTIVLQAERQQHLAFFHLIGSLTHLTKLHLPDLHLPVNEGDLSYLPLALPGLRSLQLGLGVDKSQANLLALHQLAQLQHLEWRGWSDAHLRAFCTQPPPRLSKLILRDEKELTCASAHRFSQCRSLTSLHLCNVPNLCDDRWAAQTITGLRQCRRILQLELQVESAGEPLLMLTRTGAREVQPVQSAKTMTLSLSITTPW